VSRTRRFRARRAGLLARGEVVRYRGRVDTAWALSLDRLRDQDPAAVRLLELAAFLAPEPVPLTLFSDHAELLDEPLRSAAADPDALADTSARWSATPWHAVIPTTSRYTGWWLR
jgi:hypothetical protein